MELPFDPAYQRYPSIRYPIFASGGMVNCSSAQASAAGLEILRRGGNAIDAAVAAAAALTVVEPTANGIGSDAFALFWSARDRRLYGLNASGPAPALASIQAVLADGKDEKGRMPFHGWTPVTVPGTPRAWAELTARFGRMTLAQNLAPAVRYAREGYPCAANLAIAWRQAFEKYKKTCPGPEFQEWFRTFTPEGRPYEAGDVIRLPHHADTLEAIGESNADAFYTGALAERIDADSRKFGGYLRKEDLERFAPQWVDPISVDYRGYRVWELPPNGQGITALMALNILKEFDFPEKDCALTYHRQLEAMKMAFADAFHYVTDPDYMEMDVGRLLLPAYGAQRAAEIGETAKVYSHATPPQGGTVYLCCADGEGNMVSYIQSNYVAFGSGVVVADTGIALQNRGHSFSLDPSHANCLQPGKRSYHTIIPGFLTRDGSPVGPFGVKGGFMQPQGHVQLVMNYVDFHLDPQQALDAPRWQWLQGNSTSVEDRFPSEIARQLQRRGHDIRIDIGTPTYGKGQMIVRLPNGVLVGGTESRTDSNIACF